MRKQALIIEKIYNMRIKLLILFLAISLASQAQIHLRVHQKDATMRGLPITSIDSVINDATLKRIVRNNSLSPIELPISTIDSVTHAVPVTNNLYNVISNDATLSQFKTGVDIGELNPYPYALSGNLTALVPTNTVFTNYGINTAALSASTNDYVISYHTLNGRYTTANFPVGENIKYYTTNVPADSVFITKSGSSVYVNGARIDGTASNIPASNGIAHKMTDFLFPPGDDIYTEINKPGKGYDSIAKLVARAAIQDPKIIDTLRSSIITLMAPSNASFASFLSATSIGTINNLSSVQALNILRDHMLRGRKFLVNLILATNAGTGTLSYGGAFLKLANAPNGVGTGAGQSPTGFYAYYITSAAVVYADYDYFQRNGVIQKISGILTK
jgi:uncharacterized surface protein with fasciclin (FAS1) repeats